MAALSTTSTDQPYVYEDLNLERPALRLARLFNGNGPELKCELFQAYLDERESVLPYEAVSYTWGPIDLCHSIVVNGKRLAITASLYVALQHLRYEDSDRILWVDGICINQGNHKERGHQVQQMGYIYRHAERVVFWLGLSTSEIDEFMESLRRLTKKSRQHPTASWKLRDPRWKYMWEASQPASRSLHSDLVSVLQWGLTDLLVRKWFRRAWILQEVANAQTALICCGQKSVSARLFPLMPVLLSIPLGDLQQAVLDIMPGTFRQEKWHAQNRSMYHLLTHFGSSEATEPRDIVYALRGISTDANDPSILTPDYELSEQKLVQQVSQLLFYCDINKNRVLVRNVGDLAARAGHFNNVAIDECLKSSKEEELSILLDRGNIRITDHTVRCALGNQTNGLQLLRTVLTFGEGLLRSGPILYDEAAILLAAQGDTDTMEMVLHLWKTRDFVWRRFLMAVVVNKIHAPQILRLYIDMVGDKKARERVKYLDQYLWLATLLNAETGFEAREELFRVYSIQRWQNGADNAYEVLERSPQEAFSLITGSSYVRLLLPGDTVPFTSATVASFRDQLQQHGWCEKPTSQLTVKSVSNRPSSVWTL